MSWVLCFITYTMYVFTKRPEAIMASSVFAIAGAIENISVQIKKIRESLYLVTDDED